MAISIHAPSRERPDGNGVDYDNQDFNPRSLAGATLMWLSAAVQALEFQSTLPRGSDTILFIMNGLEMNFNPRSLAGATLDFYWPSFAHLGISIHAPSRERRPALPCFY